MKAAEQLDEVPFPSGAQMPIRPRSTRRLRLALATALLSFAAADAGAQFSTSRFTIDGGGATRSTGGTFAIGGTMGQSDAGRVSGSNFSLLGGFWMGGVAVTGIEENDGVTLPAMFRMHPAFPNPFLYRTRLAFELPRATVARVSLYDAAGRLVRVLTNAPFAAGKHMLAWDRRDQSGRQVPSGVYFLRMDAGPNRSHQKLVVMH
jgi:FlgD Ig-like domain